MMSFARKSPLSWVLACRRQVHLGCEFARLAKNTSGECKVPEDLGSKSKKEKQTEKPGPAFHRDVPSYTKKIRGDTKVSAAVRASLLSKEDTKSTVLVPEELRDPAEALAACSQLPKRSELDQRRARKTQCASQLQALIVQKNSSSALTVQCVPFVKVAQRPGKRSCETAEDLITQERDPIKLAKTCIKLQRDLQVERERVVALTERYLELRAELYAKNMELKALAEGKQKPSSLISINPLVVKAK